MIQPFLQRRKHRRWGLEIHIGNPGGKQSFAAFAQHHLVSLERRNRASVDLGVQGQV